MIEEKIKIKVLPTEAHWYGVTYKEDVESVRNALVEMVNNGEYPNKLW